MTDHPPTSPISWLRNQLLGNGTDPPDAPLQPSNGRWSGLRNLRNRLAPAQAAEQSDALGDQPPTEGPADVPTISSASDMTTDASHPDLAMSPPGLDAHDIEPANAE